MLGSLLEGLISPLGITVVAILAGLGLVAFTFMGKKTTANDPMTRLKSLSRERQGQTESRLSRREETNELQRRLEKYKNFLEPASETEKSAAKLEMIQAGYHGKNAVRDFHAVKMILGLGGLMLGLAYTMLMQGDEPPSTLGMLLPIFLPTLVGYYVPIYWVNKRRAERQDQITRGFPDALDLLLICAEAGQSMDQSINRIAKELKIGYPALAEEFEQVSHETRAGKDRMEVLRDLGERSGNTDIRSFATVLIQSATYGTSTADALKVYSAEMRDKRVMLAEEKANVLPTKLTLGTMMFTVPPLLIILVGPSVFGMMKMLSGGIGVGL